MKKKIRPWKVRRGGTLTVMLGIAMAILVFGVFFLNVQIMFDYQYSIEIGAQRALNSTVEYAMDDEWRKDGFNYMDVGKAEEKLFEYLKEDLDLDDENRCIHDGDLRYTVEFKNIQYYSGNPKAHGYTGEPAGIEMDIAVELQFKMGDIIDVPITWTQHFKSTNFRTDDNIRAGTW